MPPVPASVFPAVLPAEDMLAAALPRTGTPGKPPTAGLKVIVAPLILSRPFPEVPVVVVAPGSAPPVTPPGIPMPGNHTPKGAPPAPVARVPAGVFPAVVAGIRPPADVLAPFPPSSPPATCEETTADNICEALPPMPSAPCKRTPPVPKERPALPPPKETLEPTGDVSVLAGAVTPKPCVSIPSEPRPIFPAPGPVVPEIGVPCLLAPRPDSLITIVPPKVPPAVPPVIPGRSLPTILAGVAPNADVSVPTGKFSPISCAPIAIVPLPTPSIPAPLVREIVSRPPGIMAPASAIPTLPPTDAPAESKLIPPALLPTVFGTPTADATPPAGT
nr:uncharacterized protein LOC129387948 [Dermacentor andersoni]